MLMIFLWCLLIGSGLVVLRDIIAILVVMYVKRGYGEWAASYKPDWSSFIAPFLLVFSVGSLIL